MDATQLDASGAFDDAGEGDDREPLARTVRRAKASRHGATKGLSLVDIQCDRRLRRITEVPAMEAANRHRRRMGMAVADASLAALAATGRAPKNSPMLLAPQVKFKHGSPQASCTVLRSE